MGVDDTTNTQDTEETLTNDEALDTDVTELEDDDTSFDDFDDDDTEETDDTDDTDNASESDDADDTEESDGDVADTEASTDDTEEAEQQQSREDLAKQAYEARRAERQAKAEAEAVKREAEESNIQRYLDEARDDEDEYKQREADVREYRLKEKAIELNTRSLETDLQRAITSIDLFHKGTPAIQNRLLRAAEQFEATNIVKDERGRPLEVRGDIYQYLQDEANSIRELIGDGALQQSRDKQRQQSRTLKTPVKAPKKAKVDPDLAAFDEEASSW